MSLFWSSLISCLYPGEREAARVSDKSLRRAKYAGQPVQQQAGGYRGDHPNYHNVDHHQDHSHSGHQHP